jgi:hypothetical protein
MAKITGIGGVFFKSDRDETRKWLKEKLGLETEAWGRAFPWREREDPEKKGYTVLGLHAKDSEYFAPATVDFMVNSLGLPSESKSKIHLACAVAHQDAPRTRARTKGKRASRANSCF